VILRRIVKGKVKARVRGALRERERAVDAIAPFIFILKV
jgi:hypothetical protein